MTVLQHLPFGVIKGKPKRERGGKITLIQVRVKHQMFQYIFCYPMEDLLIPYHIALN